MPDSLTPSPSTSSFRISVAGSDLAFRNEALTDPVPTGRQIIEAYGGRPADEFIVLEWLADGDLLALGGLFKQGRPMSLVREVIRSGRKNLKLTSSPGAGFDVDLMIAAGCVAETYLPAVTLEDRMCPSFRAAAEAGTIKAHCVDALSIVGGYLAAANGVPFQPVAAWKGSDVPVHNPLIARIECPFTGEKLYATRAIRPRLALLHAQEGDVYGNVRHLSTMTYADQLIARAADKVVVSVDRIVDTDDIVARSRETTIPCIYVDAIVEQPYGAHPPHHAGRAADRRV